MKDFFDKYQYTIGVTTIVCLTIKDVIEIKAIDNWFTAELNISLYIIGISLLCRHLYKKNKLIKKYIKVSLYYE